MKRAISLGRLVSAALLTAALMGPLPSHAAKMVVMEVRGGTLKVGQSIDSTAALTLKEGERVTLIGPDGKTVSRRGPYNGPILPPSTEAPDPKQALAVLIATRDARTSSIGVVRAGTDSVKIPQPWLIDVSRSGPRCLQEDKAPVLWRPDPSEAAPLVIFPADRSWRVDLAWQPQEQSMLMPPLVRYQGLTTLLVNLNQQEFAISLNIIPKAVEDPAVLAAWMLEKGCIQQADALLRMISAGQTGAYGQN